MIIGLENIQTLIVSLKEEVGLKLGGNPPQRPFKFVNVLTEMEGFRPMVEQFWRSAETILLSTYAMFRFSKNMKALKPVIRNLAKERVGHLSKRTKEAFDDLCAKQEMSMRNPTEQNMVVENEAVAKWENLSQIEEKYLKQRSKLEWLKVGIEIIKCTIEQ